MKVRLVVAAFVCGLIIGTGGSALAGTGECNPTFRFGCFVSGSGVYGFFASNSSSTGTGVRGTNSSTSGSGTGVYGSATAPGGIGVTGENSATSGAASGIYGLSRSSSGRGVYGLTTQSSGASYGVYGISRSSAGYGVAGQQGNGSGYTIRANAAVLGSAFDGHGVVGLARASERTGVVGITNAGSGYGVTGINQSNGTYGYLGGSSNGVFGATSTTTGNGVHGLANSASGTPFAIWGESNTGTGYAGFFSGRVQVNGNLLVTGSKNFVMDHPLDPANKYLLHAAVESPEMKNMYDGVVTTDGEGRASVTLPDYFTALNKDFRYQLTVVGQFAQAIVAEEIADNRFVIRTDKPGVKVSWQVTGVRNDPYARSSPMQVEQDKLADERGTYLFPEGYGQPASAGREYARTQRAAEEQRRLQAAP